MGTPFYQRSWFRWGIFLLLVAFVLGSLYADVLQAVFAPPNPGSVHGLMSLFYALGIFALTFFGSLAIISQFVLPVQTMEERRRAFGQLSGYVFDWHGPILFVKDGKVVGRKEELERYGPGVAVVDAVSAVVLQQAHVHWVLGRPVSLEEPHVRAAGPGIVFLDPGERIVAPLDLRKQSRGQAVAKALTRDGIEVSAMIRVTFRLDPGSAPQPAEGEEGTVERNRPAYPFNPTSAFRAVYGTAVGEKQMVEWTELPVTVAVERFRDVLAEHTLDSLFQPTIHGDVYPYGDFQNEVTQATKSSPVLQERGVSVLFVPVVRFKMPLDVVNQRIKNWQARWEKSLIQEKAASASDTLKKVGEWRLRTQSDIRERLQEILSPASGQADKRAFALALTKALMRASTDPETRKLLPSETLNTLEAMEEWLK
jgi:hypothetical protein